MTAAYVMGFQPEEISTFSFAWKAGMTPVTLNEVDIRGARLDSVRKRFKRPTIYPWDAIKDWWGLPC